MAIRWSLHAQQRLGDRQLSADLVEKAILEAHQRYEDPARPGRWVAHQRWEVAPLPPMLLRVFYAQVSSGGDVVVLSFYLTSQVERYWRTDL